MCKSCNTNVYLEIAWPNDPWGPCMCKGCMFEAEQRCCPETVLRSLIFFTPPKIGSFVTKHYENKHVEHVSFMQNDRHTNSLTVRPCQPMCPLILACDMFDTVLVGFQLLKVEIPQARLEKKQHLKDK